MRVALLQLPSNSIVLLMSSSVADAALMNSKLASNGKKRCGFMDILSRTLQGKIVVWLCYCDSYITRGCRREASKSSDPLPIAARRLRAPLHADPQGFPLRA